MITAPAIPTSLPRRAARAAKPPIRRSWRRAVLARAVDDTAATAGRSALVVAPHPDDETLGCGASIARRRAAGSDVTVVVVTDGRYSHRSERISAGELAAIRAEEAQAACGHLGVEPSQLRFLEFEEGAVSAQSSDLTCLLTALVDELRPDDVLTTSGRDWHTDHQAISAATRRAVRTAAHRARLLEFPIWWWVDGPWAAGVPGERRSIWRYVADPVHARRVPARTVQTGEFLAAKRRALREYRSQTTNLTGEPTWAVMDDDLLSLFLGPAELFLPVDAASEVR